MKMEPIASPEEVNLRLIILKEVSAFLKENNVDESSKSGQLLSTFANRVGSKLTESL